jgi:hypothetical protein
MSFVGAHVSGQQDADLKAAEYSRRWRAAHPGYMKAKCKAWREANPDIAGDYRNNMRQQKAFRALENWRRRCQRAGVVPPPESYWKNL